MVCNGACIIIIFLGAELVLVYGWVHEKLKPYGFPIHACIDGYFRKRNVQISF